MGTIIIINYNILLSKCLETVEDQFPVGKDIFLYWEVGEKKSNNMIVFYDLPYTLYENNVCI